jgi:hypothetical protein
VDPSVKNLREWVVLLFLLFCVLDIAGLQYGVTLAQDAAPQPNPDAGQIVSMVHGARGAWVNVYVTTRQILIFQGLLTGAALSLLATLGLIVAHGVRQVRATQAPPARAPAVSRRRKR